MLRLALPAKRVSHHQGFPPKTKTYPCAKAPVPAGLSRVIGGVAAVPKQPRGET
jgi:hypothetical protein